MSSQYHSKADGADNHYVLIHYRLFLYSSYVGHQLHKEIASVISLDKCRGIKFSLNKCRQTQ